MIVTHHVLFVAGLTGALVLIGCSGQGTSGGDTAAQSVEALLSEAGFDLDAAAPDANPTCLQQSCGPELAAFEAALSALRASEQSAVACVKANQCLSLAWSVDAGPGAARACIEACKADAGLSSSTLTQLDTVEDALEACAHSSCFPQVVGDGDAGLCDLRHRHDG